jgi:hypothetical protein
MITPGWLIVAAAILAGQTAEAQQTLTLACKGTATANDAKPEAVSVGIIINFTAGTVQGFGSLEVIDYPVKIIDTNDVTVTFSGSKETIFAAYFFGGSIDRITGDLEATFTLFDRKTHVALNRTTYSLQCKPTQRMF